MIRPELRSGKEAIRLESFLTALSGKRQNIQLLTD